MWHRNMMLVVKVRGLLVLLTQCLALLPDTYLGLRRNSMLFILPCLVMALHATGVRRCSRCR